LHYPCKNTKCCSTKKKESLTSKYSKIPNVIYCEGMI
jgi:hypothetical protein